MVIVSPDSMWATANRGKAISKSNSPSKELKAFDFRITPLSSFEAQEGGEFCRQYGDAPFCTMYPAIDIWKNLNLWLAEGQLT
jgi:hypothetical protein